MDRSVGDSDPSLNETATVRLEKPPDAGASDTDLPQRLEKRMVRNGILLPYGAFDRRLAEIFSLNSLVENDDVGALSTLDKQFLGVGLASAE